MMNDCFNNYLLFIMNGYLRDNKQFLVALFLHDVHFGE
jgi:hypothetical protein